MRRRIITTLSAILLLGAPADAADPVHYTVSFAPSGDPTLDSLLRQTSALVSLQKTLPPAPFALVGRARADAQQFLTVLHSQGYDDGSVTITINGAALDDPNLPDALTQAPASATAKVQIAPAKGARFKLGQVATPGLPSGFSLPAVMVRPGQSAFAAPILAAQPALLTALHNAGYAYATVGEPVAVADPASHLLDVTYSITPGPRVDIGPISFTGLKRMDAAFLRRHIALAPGQPYSDTAIQTARDSLLGLGVFSSVTPEPPAPVTAQDEAPITFRTLEQKRHAVTLSGLYATDTGISIGTSWLNRNLFGHAETLTLSAMANDLGGTGTTAPGYDLKAVFAKPDFYARGQTLNLSVEGLKESLTAYSRRALLVGASLNRPIGATKTITYGPSFISERVDQQGATRTYVLLQFPIAFNWNTSDSLLEPTHGFNASLTLTPTMPIVGKSHMFLIALGSMAGYVPVEANNWGIIAMRGQVGTIQGAHHFQVPPDQRFYAGGSGTVRGYTYQTIGPLFPDDTPEGGAAMDAFSLELRQHITKTIGIVPFIDAGQVSASNAPFMGTVRVGAGIGARYYTGIGPIRLDITVPLTRTAGSSGFALYIGLGEAF